MSRSRRGVLRVAAAKARACAGSVSLSLIVSMSTLRSASFSIATDKSAADVASTLTPRDTTGNASGTLARFAIPKGTQVGDVVAFEHPNPTRVSIQRFVGQDIPRLTFRLVDQDKGTLADRLHSAGPRWRGLLSVTGV